MRCECGFSISYSSVTHSGYLVELARYRARHPEQRAGQTAYNVLRVVRPDLAERALHGSKDPFYRDELEPAFLAWVEENW